MQNGKSDETPDHSERYKIQVLVLQYMAENSRRSDAKQFQINDIADQIKREEKDVQRSLYVLEGHKLVTPMPPGDFTSTSWRVTETGLSAVLSLNTTNASLL